MSSSDDKSHKLGFGSSLPAITANEQTVKIMQYVEINSLKIDIVSLKAENTWQSAQITQQGADITRQGKEIDDL